MDQEKEKQKENRESTAQEILEELDQEIVAVFEELDQVNKELFDK